VITKRTLKDMLFGAALGGGGQIIYVYLMGGNISPLPEIVEALGLFVLSAVCLLVLLHQLIGLAEQQSWVVFSVIYILMVILQTFTSISLLHERFHLRIILVALVLANALLAVRLRRKAIY
jgi:hypothetical protein